LPAGTNLEQGLIVEHDGQTFPLLPWMVVHCARKGEHGLAIVSEGVDSRKGSGRDRLSLFCTIEL
jgi:hypothetical protein